MVQLQQFLVSSSPHKMQVIFVCKFPVILAFFTFHFLLLTRLMRFIAFASYAEMDRTTENYWVINLNLWRNGQQRSSGFGCEWCLGNSWEGKSLHKTQDLCSFRIFQNYFWMRFSPNGLLILTSVLLCFTSFASQAWQVPALEVLLDFDFHMNNFRNCRRIK